MHNPIEFIDVFVAGTDGIHTYRIPSLLVSPAGDLLAFCEARKDSRRDDAPKDIVVKRSSDGGRNWSYSTVAVAGAGSDGINNPCPLIEGSTIHLFCINRAKDGERNHRLLLSSSDDDGRSWSKPVEIGERFTNYNPSFVPGPGVSLRTCKGRWIVPGCLRVKAESVGVTDSPDGLVSYACVAYSDDQGKSWRIGENVGQAWSNESQAVELANGSLLLNFRIGAIDHVGCRGIAVSHDAGETWDETFLAHELHDPVCQGGFIRCDPGENPQAPDLLICTHLHVPGRGGPMRRNLTVHLSADGGRSWPIAHTLHPGPAAYSCPAVLPDGTIGVLYECGDGHRYERLRFARLAVGADLARLAASF